jgi:hypothetical protein
MMIAISAIISFRLWLQQANHHDQGLPGHDGQFSAAHSRTAPAAGLARSPALDIECPKHADAEWPRII